MIFQKIVDGPGLAERPLRRPSSGPMLSGIVLILLCQVAILGGCAKDTPLFEDVPPADELYAEGVRLLKGRKILYVWTWVSYDKAIESFQAIIDNYPYSEYAVKAELRIADAYFEDKRYEEALSYYQSFADLHPQHEQVPYTILRAALCYYAQIGSINRDQSSTLEAQLMLERLIRQFPYSEETKQGEDLLRELRTRLARSTMEKGDFYLQRDEYQAAAERYRNLLNIYPGLGQDAEALYKLGVCYEHMLREDEALRLFHVVMANYRGTDLARQAAQHIAEAN